MNDFSVRLRNRPALRDDGEVAYLIPKVLMERKDEIAVTLAMISNRRLFGQCYRHLMPDFFESMELGSGVFIAPFVVSKNIVRDIIRPGDFDLLIIPYQQNHLIVSKTLVVEIKIVRASYIKQGKAPNEFGFSQVEGALSAGFPYVAVAHLIVSDASPKNQWRHVAEATILNADTGEISELRPRRADMMPVDLMERTFGRLVAHRNKPNIGLLSAYIDLNNDGFWLPRGTGSLENKETSTRTLFAVHNFYTKNFKRFLDTPKYS